MSLHHSSVIVSAKNKLRSWQEKVEVGPDDEKNYTEHASTHCRCSTCWLKRHQCYCSFGSFRRDYYATKLETEYSNCEIIIYYHYQEIGRSANTAHVFQMLCPSITSTLLYGDVEAEGKLFREMKEESESGAGLRTCVLYPGTNAVRLDTWIAQQEKLNRRMDGPIQAEAGQQAVSGTGCSGRFSNHSKYRIIALDGTYSQVI